MNNFISSLSVCGYKAKRLDDSSLPQMYALCSRHEKYYKEYLKQPPSAEGVREILTALPPGKRYEDKLVIGWFDGEKLVAILDLIVDFPAKKAAFIGLFMVEHSICRRGVGSKFMGTLLTMLSDIGYNECRLGVIENNAEALFFWQSLGFNFTGKKHVQENYAVLVYSKAI